MPKRVAADEVLTLFYKGYRPNEIAAERGCTRQTVCHILNRDVPNWQEERRRIRRDLLRKAGHLYTQGVPENDILKECHLNAKDLHHVIAAMQCNGKHYATDERAMNMWRRGVSMQIMCEFLGMTYGSLKVHMHFLRKKHGVDRVPKRNCKNGKTAQPHNRRRRSRARSTT